MYWLREHRANWIRVALGNGSKFDDSRETQPFVDGIRLVTFDEKGKNTPLITRPQSLMPGDGKE